MTWHTLFNVYESLDCPEPKRAVPSKPKESFLILNEGNPRSYEELGRTVRLDFKKGSIVLMGKEFTKQPRFKKESFYIAEQIDAMKEGWA